GGGGALPRPLLLCAAFAAAAPPARAEDDPRSVAVRVVPADGKPAAGANVWVFEYANREGKTVEPAPLTAGEDGKVTVPVEQGPGRRVQYIFVRDPAGRVGQGLLNAPWQRSDAPDG